MPDMDGIDVGIMLREKRVDSHIIYLTFYQEFTSFSAPHVTGTIVQMMSRNSGMIGKAETLKATLVASSHLAASTVNGNKLIYVDNTNCKVTDMFGAGVIDSDFCYRVAKNGKQATLTVNSSTVSTNTTYWSKQIYLNNVSTAVRFAISWSASHYYNTGQPYCNDYDLRIYKNGVPVMVSNAWTNSTQVKSNGEQVKNTNCEIVEIHRGMLSQYGEGYYEIRIVRTGAWQGSGTANTYIGMAWEQY